MNFAAAVSIAVGVAVALVMVLWATIMDARKRD